MVESVFEANSCDIDVDRDKSELLETVLLSSSRLKVSWGVLVGRAGAVMVMVRVASLL